MEKGNNDGKELKDEWMFPDLMPPEAHHHRPGSTACHEATQSQSSSLASYRVSNRPVRITYLFTASNIHIFPSSDRRESPQSRDLTGKWINSDGVRVRSW